MSDKEAKDYSNREIELLIDQKVADAKLDVSEKRLNHTLWAFGFLLAIFGVIVPILIAIGNSDKTEKAIEKMEAQFKELAGTALRKPDLVCLVDNKPLDGQVMRFNPNRKQVIVQMKNTGDATARNVHVRVYYNLENQLHWYPDMMGDPEDWRPIPLNDEPSYKQALELGKAFGSIDPKDTAVIALSLSGLDRKVEGAALLKLYYEQPEPKRIIFNVATSDKD